LGNTFFGRLRRGETRISRQGLRINNSTPSGIFGNLVTLVVDFDLAQDQTVFRAHALTM
jgi:hypothetical protein